MAMVLTKNKYLSEKDNIVIKRVRSSNLVNQDGQPAKWNVYTKTYLNDVIEKASAKPNSLVEEHINQLSSHELNKIDIPFDHAKPSSLIKYLCEIARVSDGEIVLDFFAGSGSTAHGVVSFNKENDTNARFLLVQLPELCDEKTDEYKAGFKIISDISKERIRRVLEAYRLGSEDSNNQEYTEETERIKDLGFKVFKLDSSNIRTWDPDASDLEQTLLDNVEHLVPGRSEQDVLYELLLKRGVDLATPLESRRVAGKTVYSIGYGVLFACLTTSIAREEVEELAAGIVAWHDELQPATDTHLFFRDSAFADDVTKTNLSAILQQHGIRHVRSL